MAKGPVTMAKGGMSKAVVMGEAVVGSSAPAADDAQEAATGAGRMEAAAAIDWSGKTADERLAEVLAAFRAGVAKPRRPGGDGGGEERLTPRSMRRAAAKSSGPHHKRIGPSFTEVAWRPTQRTEDVWPSPGEHLALALSEVGAQQAADDAQVEAQREAAVQRALARAAKYEAGDAASFVDFPFLERMRYKGFWRDFTGTEGVGARGGAWKEHFTPDGRRYFYNPTTRASVWTAPEGSGHVTSADLVDLGEPPNEDEAWHWAHEIATLTETGQLVAKHIWPAPMHPAISHKLERGAVADARHWLIDNEAARVRSLMRSRRRTAEYEAADAKEADFVDWKAVYKLQDAEPTSPTYTDDEWAA